MKSILYSTLLTLSLALVGCDQSQFAISYSRPPGADKGQITVSTSVGGGNLPTGTVAIRLRGYDQAGRLIYAPAAQPPREQLQLDGVPPEVTEVRVQAEDSEAHVLGEEVVEVQK